MSGVRTVFGFRPKRDAEQDFKSKFAEFYSADTPVDLDAITEFRGDSFPRAVPGCWLDEPDALLQVSFKVMAGELSAADAEICRQFIIDGYFIAKGLIEHELIDSVWRAYQEAVDSGVIPPAPESLGETDPHPGRYLDPHLKVPHIRDLQWHPEILRLTDMLFGRKTLPFQTIMGHKGSVQRAHSDAIHMTTYPLGFLIANWIALEDIHEDSGPLFYYPGSHRMLPYLLSHDVRIPPGGYRENPGVYLQYENVVQAHIEAYRLEPKTFVANKGDILFWHSNLIHGGSMRRDLRHSRKALVCHYFAERAVTYHDLAGLPSRLHRNGLYAPAVCDPPLR